MKKSVSKFFKEDVPIYGSYDNLRKLPNSIDGFKISQRKLLWTGFKKARKEFIKTETFANLTVLETAYIHGSVSLCTVCDSLVQRFVGAANYTFFDGNSGGWGCRQIPRSSAPRYTRLKLNSLADAMFNQYDIEILDKQYFEGQFIEPKFLIPVFPLIFLNPQEGLSTGFASKIYPRNPIEISEYIKKKLAGVENPRMAFLPWFRGFKGTVRYNEEIQSNEVVGCIERINTTNYVVTELPIGIEYQKYVEFLDKLIDNGTIVDYEDKCDPKTDNILFEIKTTRAFTKQYEDLESLNRVFHLIKTLPENLNCIDETGRIHEYSSIQEILDSFIAIRLEYYQKRKDYLLKTLKREIEILVSKYVFCKGIVEKKIVVSNKKKDEIVKQLESFDKISKQDGSYSYLLNMPIHSVSHEKMEELKAQLLAKKEEYMKIRDTSIEDMWREDLKNVEKALK